MIKHSFTFKLHIFFLFFISSFNSFIFSHGFHKDTIIYSDNDNNIKTIGQIVEDAKKSFFNTVISYNIQKGTWIKKDIQAGDDTLSPFYCILSFNEPLTDSSSFFTVTCSPTQQFYRISDNQWIPVYKLRYGDLLLAEHNKHIRLNSITFINEPLDMYTVDIKGTHNFLITKYGLVAQSYREQKTEK